MKKIYRNLIIIIVSIYVIFTLVSQQKTLNEYAENSKELSKQIEEQEQYKEELAKQKEEANSLEVIEQTAREKLDMYYPNEKVYLDQGMYILKY